MCDQIVRSLSTQPPSAPSTQRSLTELLPNALPGILKSSITEGILIKPNLSSLTLDCHVDANFAGNWNIQDPDNPDGVKLRTGHLLTFGDVPLVWKSANQTMIAMSTMESECIACLMASRALAFVRALLPHIKDKFSLACGGKISAISAVFSRHTWVTRT